MGVQANVDAKKPKIFMQIKKIFKCCLHPFLYNILKLLTYHTPFYQ